MCLGIVTGLAVFHGDILGIPQVGVFAKTDISKGTRFGPYRGKIVQTSEIKANDDCSVMWEVRFVDKVRAIVFLDDFS